MGRIRRLFKKSDQTMDHLIVPWHHHMGTTRMSDDPRKGIVDSHCRVHSVKNLFVAGSSIFPTSGHANPTYTIVALAIRLADHIKNVQSRII